MSDLLASECGHMVAGDHRSPRPIAKGEPRWWICTVCKGEFQWNKHAATYANIECSRCTLQAVDAVVCSVKCAKAYKR